MRSIHTLIRLASRQRQGQLSWGVKLVDVTFGVLGRTALLIDGHMHETWGRPRERAVLGALLVHAGRWVPVDTLIEWAWPDEEGPPRYQGPTFHTYAGRIRKSLRQLPSPPILKAGNGSYRLEVDKSQIDYYRFTALLGEARTYANEHDSRKAAAAAQRAIDLWRGQPLADLAGEPARAWRLRVMQDDWLGAHRILVTALLDLREFDTVLTRVSELQTDHPNDIALATQRMSALYGLGRYEEETAYYFAVRRGLHRDGDEAATEHVRRHHEGLRTRMSEPGPQPRNAPAAVPRQLRHDIPDFVGRNDLLTALDAAVTVRGSRATSGVVVIDGMAGVGKTALVKHWGHRSRRHFPDGDLYVDLNGYAENGPVSQSTVVDDFLIVLEHPPDAELNGRARELLLTRLVSGRRMLVILDNAHDAKAVENLVALFPEALVLVTSRQQLGSLTTTTGARRVHVDPMTQSDATMLLSARIGTRRALTDHDRARLAALCGGLPLTITLLAEHVATSPSGQLSAFADQLDHRQLVFDVGEDAGSATVQTFFGWSYRSLAAPERRLFRTLSIHPGKDFSFEAMCALDGRNRAETTHSVRTLVSSHLLERAEAFNRFRFHDLIREFAIHCAEADEPASNRQAAIRRLTSFYLATAIRANRALYPSRIPATELAVEDGVEPTTLADTAQAKAFLDTERTNLLAMAHKAAANGHHDHTWRLADAVVIYFDRHGYFDDSLSMHRLALTSAKSVNDQIGEASSLVGLGRVYLTIGELAEARRHLETALRRVEDMGHEGGQVATLGLLGKLETQQGNLSAALELYRRGLKIAQRADDPQGLCWTCCRLGEVLRATEQYDTALIHLARAQILAERRGDKSAYASAMLETSRVYRDQREHLAAVAHCQQALTVAEEIPDLVIVADACVTLAEIHKLRGDTDSAIECAKRAISVSKSTGAVYAYDLLGDCYHASGDIIAAKAAWQEAAERYEQLGNSARASVVHAKLEQPPDTSVIVPSARSTEPRPAPQHVHERD
jgi:tetratricopeptide (TPR) repeat protein/DNA-binding SARP family transcriptional activator